MTFEDFCVSKDISIITLKLPNNVRGFVYYDGLGYHVIINQNLSYEQSQKTLKHELLHIINNHFERELTIEQAEQEVHLLHDFEFCFV